MNTKKLIILAILLGLSFGRIAAQVNTYLGGDGITTVTKGSPVTGTLPSNLNANDSLYYEVSSRGGGGNLSVLAGLPKPMQGASQGRWGAIFVNPTDSAVTVTRVDIIADTSLFSGVSGIVPVTGWSLVGNDTVRWSGSLSVSAHEAYDFMADIAGNNLNATGRQIKFRVATSAGTFENIQSQNQADADPYVNLYYVDGGNDHFVSPVILSGASSSFAVRLSESSSINALPSGTTLTIEIPAGWQNVLAGDQSGFTTPFVSGNSETGWTITAATTADLQGNNLDFTFSAVAPMVGTNSVYTFNTYLSIGAKCEFAVRVSQPVGGTGQGGILSITALSGIPKPMDTGTWGAWGATIVNPTADDITVTQLDILAGGGTLLFKAATGTSPATGWTRPSASNVRWSGSLVVPAYSAYDFICQIRANRKAALDNPVTISFTTSAGIYEDAEHTTTQSSSALYYANLYYLETGNPCYAIDGVMSASPKDFTLQIKESSNLLAIPSGQTLQVEIPAGFTNVSANAQTSWTTPNISGDAAAGWTITANTTITLKRKSLNFIFSATPPLIGITSIYKFNTTFQTGSVCEAAVQVINPAGGIRARHLSPAFAEPVNTISRISLNAILRSSLSANYYLQLYNCSGSAWEGLSAGVVDTTEAAWQANLNGSFSNYLDPQNKLLVRLLSTESKTHISREDYLTYKVSQYKATGVDKASSIAPLGASNLPMEELIFSTYAGTVSVDTLRLTFAGINETDVAGVKLFDDVNGNGILDAGETQIGTTQTFSAAWIATFTGTPLFSFSSGANKNVLITFDITGGPAAVGRTVGVEVVSNTDITTNLQEPFPGDFPISSSLSTINNTAPAVSNGLATPSTLPPDGITATVLTAKVVDPQDQSTISSVTVNLTSIGSGAADTLYDDGTHGDAVPGDSIFTRGGVKATAGTSPGTYTLTVTATDLDANIGTGSINLTVSDITPPAFSGTTDWPDTSYQGPYTVTSTINDNYSGVSACSLYCKVNSGSFIAANYTVMGNPYYFTIPGAFTLDTIAYYLKAVDGAGNSSKDPAGAPATVFSFVVIDVAPPYITDTSPDSGAVNVAVSAPIAVTFSEPMDTASLTFTSLPDPSGWVRSWSSNNSVLTLSHIDFSGSTQYLFQITNATDKSGKSLISGTTPNPWTFTTADISAPYIVSTSPTNNATAVTLADSVIVVFSEGMDTASVILSSAPDPGGWQRSWSNNYRRAAYAHNSFLETTTYTIGMTGQDSVGFALSLGLAPNPWQFATIDATSPYFVFTYPVDGATDVLGTTAIVIRFSERMDTLSLISSCSPDPGGWTSAFSLNDSQVVYSHNPFSAGQLHTFQVLQAKDRTGNNLTSSGIPNPFQFTVKAVGVEGSSTSLRTYELRMEQNRPNPFGQMTEIRYSAGADALVRLKIYNIAGQLIKTLVDERVAAGIHTCRWNARDWTGKALPSGVYLIRFSAGRFSQIKKMVLLR